MAVTIKEIAAAAGVSRGTVDRVLHNRKDVKPEVAEKIRALAESLGYVPNKAGKILAARKQNIRFGCMLPDVDNPFFKKVIAGFHRAEEELADYGVSVEVLHVRGFTESEHLSALQMMLEADYSGVCVTTLDVPDIRQKLDAFSERGIPVVCVNTDVLESGRICYVGTDYVKAGKTAAGMLSLCTGEMQRIIIVSGSFEIRGHNDRIQGFLAGLSEHAVPHTILRTVEAFDNNEDSYQITKQLLGDYPSVTALFIAAGGFAGVYKAVNELCRTDVFLVLFDDIPAVVQALKDGGIRFTVCQNPEMQGYMSIMRLFTYLMEEGKKPAQDYITETTIKISDNC